MSKATWSRRGPALVGGWLTVVCLALGTNHLVRAQEMEMAKPGKASAPLSAKERLEELRRAREKQEKADKPAPRATTKTTDGKYPWSTPDDVTYVDSMLEEEWKALGFPVSEPCTDGEFIRRASLDIIGRVPTLEETQEFLRDKSSDKRAQLVDRLLASDEYGKNWAIIWTRRLITDVGNQEEGVREHMAAWLEREFNRNTPWDQMVTEMVAGTGRWDENGAVAFLISNIENGNNTSRATSYMTKLFLGVQTQCTECHNHPWNEWKQEQFHGLRAFFLGTRENRVTKVSPNGRQVTDYIELEETPYQELGEKGTYYAPRNGLEMFVPPTYIDGRDVNALLRGEKARGPVTELVALESISQQVDVRFDDEVKDEQGPVYLRRVLAKAMTAPDNRYFGRAIVNRLWYHYFGHSFIKAVDDFDNGQDEPTMPDLLNRLASDFRANGNDLKRLTRWICTSKGYSLSSRIKPARDGEDTSGFFTHVLVKPMTPEQLYDSVLTVTQMHKTSKTDNTAKERAEFLQQFQRTFGSEEIPTTAPKYEGTISSSLMMMNSPLMQRATSCEPGSFLHALVTDRNVKELDAVQSIYLAALSRLPNSIERQYAGRLFQMARTPQEKQEALQDVLWVVLNSAEFFMNH